MVQLNKPVKYPFYEENNYSSPEKREHSGSVIEDSLSEEEKRAIYEKKEKRLLFLLDLNSVLVLLVAIFTVTYAIYYLAKDHNPPYISTVAHPKKYKEILLKDKEVFTFDIERLNPPYEDVEAESILAFNPITHQIYVGRGEDDPLPIASITKLMTALVALEHFEGDQLLEAKDMSDGRLEWLLGLKDGDIITFEDALEAMLINSYNDVAFLVAQNHPNGYEGFINEMNKKAKLIGMESTRFENPAGLDDLQNYSNASDLKKLVQKVLMDETIMDVVSMKNSEVVIYTPLESRVFPEGKIKINDLDLNDYSRSNVKLINTNELLDKDPFIAGLKTGYTSAAGPSFIGYYSSSSTDQLVTILLNANGDRFEETVDLVNIIRNYYSAPE